MSIIEDRAPRASRKRPLRVAILGASGSIGTQTLDVCRRHRDKIDVVALAVGRSCAALAAAAREFGARYLAVADPTRRDDPALADLPAGARARFGRQAVIDLATLPDVDCVVCAVVGNAGIAPGYAALKAGKVLAYSNKESIVSAGDLLMPLAKPGRLIPVDSEHSAIYQCLAGERHEDVYRIWLTCSGGPFYGMTRGQLEHVSARDALAHPTWSMGAKITIDSATLMNKGLEVLEACRLFEVGIDQVRVLVQRQSRIHSMVEFADGSTKAQLGPSDMRIAIQYALSYPERWESPVERLDFCKEPPVTFGEADEETFGCLALAREVGRRGGTLPCTMNAANEVANLAFREGRCGFLDIERVVRAVVDEAPVDPVESIAQLEEVDARGRAAARAALAAVVA